MINGYLFSRKNIIIPGAMLRGQRILGIIENKNDIIKVNIFHTINIYFDIFAHFV